jgi:hypothetical protein
MADAVFPQPVAEVISTLAELFRHNGRGDVVELLKSATADVDLTDYDNWNGGTCTWATLLDIILGRTTSDVLLFIMCTMVTAISYAGERWQ